MEDIQEKFYGGEAQTREAFDELCAMVGNMKVSLNKMSSIRKVYTSSLLHRMKEKKEENK